MHVRILLARYRSFFPCPDCGGARLCPEALQVQLGGRNLAELCAEPIPRLRERVEGTFLSAEQLARSGRLLMESRGKVRRIPLISDRFPTEPFPDVSLCEALGALCELAADVAVWKIERALLGLAGAAREVIRGVES